MLRTGTNKQTTLDELERAIRQCANHAFICTHCKHVRKIDPYYQRQKFSL